MAVGRLEVIVGPMFSGKTTELLRRMRHYEASGVGVQLFKPALDKRYSESAVVSHDDVFMEAFPLITDRDLLLKRGVDVVGVDEVQFLGSWIVDRLDALVMSGCRVIVAGLDVDFMARPFGAVPELLAKADEIIKLTAICTSCGDNATRTKRLSDSTNLVEVGGSREYTAVCLQCYKEYLK